MKKILLIRFSSIGDIVLTTPVIRSLKTQLDAEIHTVTKKKYAFLYQNNPNVDKVFSFNKEEQEVIPDLLKEQYDFVVDLQKNLRSFKIKKSLKAPSASFPKKNIQKWLMVNFKVNILPENHVVDRYFEALKHLNVSNDGKGLEYYIPNKDVINIADVYPELASGYIGLVIGGQHFTKIVPPEKAAEIVKQLELPVVLLGGKEDFERGEEIVTYAPKKTIINTCGKYNLNRSASLVQQCKVLITNDTGLMHIGTAFQKPIVSVWGNTIPGFGMYPYMPGHQNRYYLAEVKGLSCRPCSKLGYKKCPKSHFNCMMNQDVDTIVNKVNAFIK